MCADNNDILFLFRSRVYAVCIVFQNGDSQTEFHEPKDLHKISVMVNFITTST
jgi:hypothetical protein